jgi:hypothetical protein
MICPVFIFYIFMDAKVTIIPYPDDFAASFRPAHATLKHP